MRDTLIYVNALSPFKTYVQGPNSDKMEDKAWGILTLGLLHIAKPIVSSLTIITTWERERERATKVGIDERHFTLIILANSYVNSERVWPTNTMGQVLPNTWWYSNPLCHFLFLSYCISNIVDKHNYNWDTTHLVRYAQRTQDPKHLGPNQVTRCLRNQSTDSWVAK